MYIRQLVRFMQVFDDRFLAESGWNCSYILMGREDARNM